VYLSGFWHTQKPPHLSLLGDKRKVADVSKVDGDDDEEDGEGKKRADALRKKERAAMYKRNQRAR